MPVITSEDHKIPLGTACPDFALKNVVTGEDVTRASLMVGPDGEARKGLCVMFLCNHCPVVGLIRTVMVELVKTYQAEGIAFVGIMPNELGLTPMNGPEEMKYEVDYFGYTFPYCCDADTQDASRAIGVTVTPEFFVYKCTDDVKNMPLVYRGDFDPSRPAGKLAKHFKTGEHGRVPDGCHLRAALDAVLRGDGNVPQYCSEGCSVKFLPNENEPEWSNSEYQYPDALEHHGKMNRQYFFYKTVYDIIAKLTGGKRAPIGNELNFTFDGGRTLIAVGVLVLLCVVFLLSRFL